MKSSSSHPPSSSQAGAEILSKYLSVDELLIRPVPSSLDEGFVASEPQSKLPRISLVRFQELEQRIRNSPVDPAPYRELAEIYAQQSRWKDARRVLEQGVRHNPDDNALLTLHEEAQLQLVRQSLDAARLQVQARPSTENEEHLQRCEIDLANLRLSVCEARLQRNPEQIELIIPCAIALRQLGRMDESIAKLRLAVMQPPLRSRAALQLGMCLQQSGQIVEALAAYRQAALFRAPPPPPELKTRALELAIDLAEQSGLIHSARLYTEYLLQVEGVDQPKWKKHLTLLQKTHL